MILLPEEMLPPRLKAAPLALVNYPLLTPTLYPFPSHRQHRLAKNSQGDIYPYTHRETHCCFLEGREKGGGF
jgi:hypothetical protein